MDLKTSILQTLRFFDLFDYPLTPEEIKRHLFNYHKPVHIKEIRGTLDQMETTDHLRDYYFLKGRERLPKIREGRQYRSEQYWNRVKFYGLHMRRVPFIRMIAVCNNLTYNNVSETSDIDLLIVTRPGRLWTARALLTLLLHFFGVRRHGDKIAGRFCLSFFVTTKKLDFEPVAIAPEDPYLAWWMTLLCPIEGRETFEDFKKQNESWLLEKYGLRFSPHQECHFYTQKPSALKRFLEWLLGGRMGNLTERILKSVLERRARRKAARLHPATCGVVIEAEMLKFHDRDRRREYYERWKLVASDEWRVASDE